MESLREAFWVHYINDLPELCASQDDSSKLYLYADDAKIFKVVSQVTDQLDLQAIMNTVKTWSDEWLLAYYD